MLELIEVELTAKTISRYQAIHRDHSERLAEAVNRVRYFCTPDVETTIAREADKFVFRDQRSRLLTTPSFDHQGRWRAEVYLDLD